MYSLLRKKRRLSNLLRYGINDATILFKTKQICLHDGLIKLQGIFQLTTDFLPQKHASVTIFNNCFKEYI